MSTNIGEQIISYARSHKAELEQLQKEKQTSFSKLDIASLMVKAGILSESDIQSLKLNTTDTTIWSSGYLESDEVNYDENIYSAMGIKINLNKMRESSQTTNLPITKSQQTAYEIFKTRLEKATSDFNAQMEYDGLFEDMADAMGRIWGDNYADAVRKDLAEVKKQQDRLEVAMWNQVRFNEEWEAIHGVPFNEQNVRNFLEYQNSFAEAYISNAVQENFAENYKALLADHGLQEEAKVDVGPIMHTGMSLTTTTVIKKDRVYQRDFNKLAKLFDDVIYANTRTKAENKRLETINGTISRLLEQRKNHEPKTIVYDMLTSTIQSLCKEKVYLESKDGSFKKNLEQNVTQLKAQIKVDTEELASFQPKNEEEQAEYNKKQQAIKDNQTALQVYELQLEALNSKNGAEFLEKYISKQLGNGEHSQEQKYAVLQNLAKTTYALLENQTKKACNGVDYATYEKRYDNSFKAVFGNNDIIKRVQEYNLSQIKGGGYMKTATIMAIFAAISGYAALRALPVMLSLGTEAGAAAGAAAGTEAGIAASASAFGGEAAVGAAAAEVTGAGVSGALATASAGAAEGMTGMQFALMSAKTFGTMAGATFGAEVLDRATSGAVRHAFKNGSVSDALSKMNEVTDWGEVVKASATSGAIAVAFGTAMYPVSNLCMVTGASKLTTAAANFGTATALGLGSEYLMTGEITVEGTVFTVLLAATMAGMSVLQIKAQEAYQKGMQDGYQKGYQDAYLKEMYDGAREFLKDDIALATQKLQASGKQTTPENVLKQLKRDIGIKYHPDRQGFSDSSPEYQAANNMFAMKNGAIDAIEKYYTAHASEGQNAPNPQTVTATNPEIGFAQNRPKQPSRPGLPAKIGEGVPGDLSPKQGQPAQSVPINRPSISSMAASESGPAAQVPVAGGTTPVHGETVADVISRVTSQSGVRLKATVPSLKGGTVDIYADSNGQTVLNVIKDQSGQVVHTIEAIPDGVTETINGAGTTLNAEIQQIIDDVNSKVASTKTVSKSNLSVTYEKDASGKNIKTIIKQGNQTSVEYNNGSTSVRQTYIDDNLVGTLIVDGYKETDIYLENNDIIGVHLDANGMITDGKAYDKKSHLAATSPSNTNTGSPVEQTTSYAIGTQLGSEIQQIVTDVDANIVTSKTVTKDKITITQEKNANGETIKTTVKQNNVTTVVYNSGSSTFSQTYVGDNLIGGYLGTNGTKVNIDSEGVVTTAEAYSKAFDDAINNLKKKHTLLTNREYLR